MLKGSVLGLHRGGKAILQQVSLSLCAGELILVLGPSGSGKSTLMRLLAGLTAPDDGEVSLDDRVLSKIPEPELARLIGHVPQDDIIHHSLRVEQALTFAARLRMPGANEADVSARVGEVIARLELGERRSVRIHRLSGGQRKRVNLGVELLVSPRFLILDEPTSGLDPALEEAMMRLFRKLCDEGRGILCSTHAMASVDLADQLCLVMDGQLIYFGPPAEALRHFKVSHPADIFKALRGAPAAEHRRRFEATPLASRRAARRREAPPSGALAEVAKLAAATRPNTPASPPPASAPQAPQATAPAAPAPQGVDELLASLAAEVEAERRGGLGGEP